MDDLAYGAVMEVLEVYVDHLRQLDQVKGGIMMEELTMLNDAGALVSQPSEALVDRSIRIAVDKAEASLASHGISRVQIESKIRAEVSKEGPGGAGFVVFKYSGKTMYYPQDGLTMTNHVRDYMRFRGRELAMLLIEFHERAGLLSSDEAQKLLTSVLSGEVR